MPRLKIIFLNLNLMTIPPRAIHRRPTQIIQMADHIIQINILVSQAVISTLIISIDHSRYLAMMEILMIEHRIDILFHRGHPDLPRIRPFLLFNLF